jgi:hypothetical protein
VTKKWTARVAASTFEHPDEVGEGRCYIRAQSSPRKKRISTARRKLRNKKNEVVALVLLDIMAVMCGIAPNS